MNPSPRVLGSRYEVGDLLGRGGMAEVHLGRDTRLGRVVAIKLLRTDLARDPVFQARFRREAQSAAGLNHPSIVAVYDTGEETITESGGGVVALPWIVMEYVEGRTLREVLRDGHGKPLDVAQALELTSGVLSALEYSHRMGIVHRDIKPANVMLTAHGDVKVMDFGIARALADVSATMTQTQAVIGTAQYLSPEQARGETVDARSDLYSAGCLLYELMAARPPFVADSPVAVAYQHVREQANPPSTYNPLVPEVVDRVVLHALAKDREARYQTAAEFRTDVDAARAGRTVTAVATMLPPTSAADSATEYLPAAAATGTRAYPPLGPDRVPTPQPVGVAVPGPEQSFSRRGQDRRGAANDSGRKAGFAVLAVLVVVLFAVAAFMVARLVSLNSTNATVTIPTVAGLTEAKARDTLAAKGLVAGTVEQQANASVAKGQVIKTDPAAGKSVKRSTSITLFVSTGTDKKAIPDVVDKTLDEAKALLTASGFQVGQSYPKKDTGKPANTVTGSSPAVGTEVPVGSKVALYYADGSLQMPAVEGKNVGEAKPMLEGMGLKSITENQVQHDSAPAGTVLHQEPAAGSEITSETPVTLTVSSGPADQNNNNNDGNNNGNNNNGNPGSLLPTNPEIPWGRLTLPLPR